MSHEYRSKDVYSAKVFLVDRVRENGVAPRHSFLKYFVFLTQQGFQQADPSLVLIESVTTIHAVGCIGTPAMGI